ncbi:histamine H2 receptor-like [Asterias amurensis]|uniref:histamine H2 receptor-like n=1 Tax=Asterias amurensis TaxID=7602 RepID=UPI003AB3A2AC
MDEFFLTILKTIIGTIGILGNGLVCVVIAKVPAMRTLTNAIIFNQAVIDFLASLFLVLLGNIKPQLPQNDSFGAVLHCAVWDSSILVWMFFTASTFNLVLLTLERYVAIMYPFQYVTYFGRKQVTIMLFGVWVLATGYKARIIGYKRVVNGECERITLSDDVYVVDGIFTFLIEYFIPLVIMTFCYVRIAMYLKRKATTVQPGLEPNNQDVNSMSGSLIRARRNTLKTLFIVFVTYTICWTPNQLAFFMYNFGLYLDLQGDFYFISVVLIQLNSCINPIIYSFKYKKFQRGVRVLFRPCLPRRLLARTTVEDSISVVTFRTRREEEPTASQ